LYIPVQAKVQYEVIFNAWFPNSSEIQKTTMHLCRAGYFAWKRLALQRNKEKQL